jgi:Phage integrase family
LRWCDIDLDGKTAVISQQLQQYDGRLAVCPPKTSHSARVIALDHTTVAALRAHRDRQLAEAAAFGPGWRASGFVFTNLNGDPMAPDRLTRTFRHLAIGAGLPPVRLHDLRHGAATLALAAGVDLRVVQEMPRPLQHRADRRYLHLCAARRGAHGGGEGRHADHPGGLPGPRHAAPSAAAGHPEPSPRPGRKRADKDGSAVTGPSRSPARPPSSPAPQTHAVTAPADAFRRPCRAHAVTSR